jgi:uncharacterized membrane protein YcjF (UPF0283 family)
LRAYLEGYELDETGAAPLHVLGLSETELDGLRAARGRLLDPGRFSGNHRWLEDYRDDFQGVLDRLAAGRVERFARRAAWKTAVSPNALLDTLIVGYLSFALLTDLCRIYRLRLGAGGTALVLAHVFFVVYLSGEIDNLEDTAAEGVQSLFDSSNELVGFAIGKFASKGAAAALNYALLGRLGRSALRLLRPLDPR